MHRRGPRVANRRKTARNFAEAKKVALGKDKISDGGYDRRADGRAGWNADVGSRFHPKRTDLSEETEYVGPQSTSYSRSTRTKVALDPHAYLMAGAAGASLGSVARGGLAVMAGRRIARFAPIAGGLIGLGAAAVSHIRERRRNKMVRRWARTGVPSYSSRIR